MQAEADLQEDAERRQQDGEEDADRVAAGRGAAVDGVGVAVHIAVGVVASHFRASGYSLGRNARRLASVPDGNAARLGRIPQPENIVAQNDLFAAVETDLPDIGPNTTIAALAEEAAHCTRCHLFKWATQTVFGEGPPDARIVMVGEQPGDQEDLQGKPFVGPAGKVLDRAMEEAGIDRSTVYVTNAVKHFKFEPRGKRRIHKKPDRPEIEACKWWLDREVAVVRPKLIVALGATAGQALYGRAVRIMAERGRVSDDPRGFRMMLTVHPSFLLRLPDAKAKEREFSAFVADLKKAA